MSGERSARELAADLGAWETPLSEGFLKEIAAALERAADAADERAHLAAVCDAASSRVHELEAQLAAARPLADWCACADEWGEEQDSALAEYRKIRAEGAEHE